MCKSTSEHRPWHMPRDGFSTWLMGKMVVIDRLYATFSKRGSLGPLRLCTKSVGGLKLDRRLGILGPTEQLKREGVIVDDLIAEHSGRAVPDLHGQSVSPQTRRLSWPA